MKPEDIIDRAGLLLFAAQASGQINIDALLNRCLTLAIIASTLYSMYRSSKRESSKKDTTPSEHE